MLSQHTCRSTSAAQRGQHARQADERPWESLNATTSAASLSDDEQHSGSTSSSSSCVPPKRTWWQWATGQKKGSRQTGGEEVQGLQGQGSTGGEGQDQADSNQNKPERASVDGEDEAEFNKWLGSQQMSPEGLVVPSANAS